MVWFSLLLKNYPQFVVIHTVKGFDVVNKAVVDAFLVFPCLFDPTDVGNLISGSSAFSKYNLYIWEFSVHILLSITLLACETSTVVQYFEHSFAGPFFGIGMKTDLSQSCGHY